MLHLPSDHLAPDGKREENTAIDDGNIYTKLWEYMGNDGNIFGYFRSISWDCHGNIMEVMMNIECYERKSIIISVGY